VYSLVYPNIPTITEEVVDKVDNLYTIPRSGDILHEIRIDGLFTRATLFQYGWGNDYRVVHETLKYPANTMQLFGVSGIPLICLGKNVYLEVDADEEVVI
jgi:hypothetical protein